MAGDSGAILKVVNHPEGSSRKQAFSATTISWPYNIRRNTTT
jgi:hypothetical protein